MRILFFIIVFLFLGTSLYSQFIYTSYGDGKVIQDPFKVFTSGEQDSYKAFFSHDGEKIIGLYEKSIGIWDVNSGKLLDSFQVSDYTTKTFSVSPDNTHIALGDIWGRVKVWDIQSKQRVKFFNAHDKGITSIAFSNSGKYFLTGSYDNSAKLWNINSEGVMEVISHQNGVLSVAFSPTENIIATGDLNGSLIISNLDKPSSPLLQIKNAHPKSVGVICFSPDGKNIISSGSDKIVKLWDIKTGRLIRTFSDKESDSEIESIDFSRDGSLLIIAPQGGYTRLLDPKTGKILLSYNPDGFINHIEFSQQGGTFLTSTYDLADVTRGGRGFIELWKIPTIFLPLKTRIKSYVETNFSKWQQKGEFEKLAGFKERVNPTNAQQKQKELIEKIINQIVHEKDSMNFPWLTLEGIYDSENETFLLKSNDLGHFILPVAIEDGQKFKSKFKSAKTSDVQVTLNEQGFIISSFQLSIPGLGQFPYNLYNNVQYQVPNVAYEGSPIDLKLNVPVLSDQPSKSDPGLQVFQTPEVDLDIPVTSQKKTNAYALIIGNEDYQRYQIDLGSESNVPYARQDARIFREYAVKTLGIPEQNILYLEDATSSPLQRELEAFSLLMKTTQGEGEFYFFYAGHGAPDPNTHTSYIIPVDVSGIDLIGAISLEDIYTKLSTYPAKKVSVFIDACFSGGGRNKGLLANARPIRIIRKTGQLKGNMVVFNASSSSEIALPYHEKQHGLFTYFLLKKLQETKGELNYGELASFLKQEVNKAAILEYRKEQTPVLQASPSLGDNWKNWTFKK